MDSTEVSLNSEFQLTSERCGLSGFVKIIQRNISWLNSAKTFQDIYNYLIGSDFQSFQKDVK